MAVRVGFDFRRLGVREAAKLFFEACLNAGEPSFCLALHVHVAKEFWPGYAVPAADIYLLFT